MKRGVKILIFSFLLLAVAIPLAVYSPTGNVVKSDYCVDAVVTDISPTSIGVDKEFTVGVLIDNCGDKNSENVSFELLDIGPEIKVKEPLIKDIGEMGYANSDRFLVYHMKTSSDIVPGEYVINYKLIYYGATLIHQKTGNFSVTVIADEAKLSLASVKTNPVLVKEGDTTELTIRVENYGNGNANSLKVSLEHPFEGIQESFIGTLDADEDGPAVFTFVAGKNGIYKIPITISYKDDFGEHILEKEISLSILKKDTNWFMTLFILIILGIFGYALYYLWEKNKKKEDVIKQLLGSKEKSSEKKKRK